MKMKMIVVISILLIVFSLSSKAMSLEDEQESVQREEDDLLGFSEEDLKAIKEHRGKECRTFRPRSLSKISVLKPMIFNRNDTTPNWQFIINGYVNTRIKP
uniref:Putative venom toxin n=1 Tax=Tityus obscurus TaxID=1221240 RepID=A0A1E1WWD3_TITOB